MNNQLLRDPEIKPTAEVIAQCLGAVSGVYTKFVGELGKYGITLMEWRYYNDGKAWLSKGEYKWTTARGTAKVKPLFWLSIWEGFFKVSFFFAERLRDELLEMELSAETKKVIESGGAMGKSKQFFPVILDIKESRQLADVYKIAEFRKEKVE